MIVATSATGKIQLIKSIKKDESGQNICDGITNHPNKMNDALKGGWTKKNIIDRRTRAVFISF